MTQIWRLPGLTPYAEAHALQERLVAARARGEIADTILLLEHANVITVGRTRLAEQNVLQAGDWPVVAVERGGDVTWHGPGQLVAYPIVLLEGPRQDLHKHLHSLEAAAIEVCTSLGLAGRTDPRNTGVWLPCADGAVRKVCSVGIACRKWVTWHGLALNVNPDPSVFSSIRPCGFDADIMTRLCDHTDVRLDALVEPLAAALTDALGIPRGAVVRGTPDIG